MENEEFDELENELEENQENEKSNKRRWLVILAILLIICGLGAWGIQQYNNHIAQNEDDKISSIANTTVANNSDIGFSDSENLLFSQMSQELSVVEDTNEEAYAWIYVPDTNVDYPICQSYTDNAFYLRHSGVDRSYVASGAIYTESHNTNTFNDRVTLIYGHNGYGDTMFTTLHKFEDPEFFNDDAHQYFYIYTKMGRCLKYQVVSAFKYDNRHIMNSFDFQNNQVFTDFLTMIQNPSSTNKNVRTELDTQITNDNKVVVLSTCITNQKSNRYLVCGVLVQDEEIN